jgi:hypothetical protein
MMGSWRGGDTGWGISELETLSEGKKLRVAAVEMFFFLEKSSDFCW